MRFLKKILIKILPLVDYFLLLPLLIGIPFFYFFSRLGGRRLPLSRKLLKKLGIYPIRNHYYQPLFDDSQLKKSLNLTRELPAIEINDKKQLKLLENLIYSKELKEMELDKYKQNHLDFSFQNNGGFCSGDAEFLYQIIRYFKPKRIIEIGSGFSTKIINHAIKMNKQKDGSFTNLKCIEPYEMPWLEDLGVEVQRELVQNIKKSIFDELQSNDILFIDSSHIIRPQGDVLTEYLEIIPKLNKGVIVHVHDIFTPRDYLESWIKEDVRFWNEQYILEALLSNSNRYEIIAALNYLHHSYFMELKKVCPYLKKNREPGSFYFKIK